MISTIAAAIKRQREEASLFVVTMSFLVTTFLAILAIYVFASGLWAYIVRGRVTEEGTAGLIVALLWLPIMRGAYALSSTRKASRDPKQPA